MDVLAEGVVAMVMDDRLTSWPSAEAKPRLGSYLLHGKQVISWSDS